MAIPDFQTIMRPLLEFASDGQPHRTSEAADRLAETFRLSEDDRNELLPSGRQPLFNNRIAWAGTYLKKAGLLEAPKRGFFQITSEGRKALKSADPINVRFLDCYPGVKEWRSGSKSSSTVTDDESDDAVSKTPEDLIKEGFDKIQKNLKDELLTHIKDCSPTFFEKLVVDLLQSMGYGGGRKGAALVVGKSGDEGIDGIINEDRLGLDVIYVQAKKWGANVSRPEIQKFMGALMGKKARKGVFITASDFTKEARSYDPGNDVKIALINGDELTTHMIDYDLGVSLADAYKLKKIDTDYFVEE